jgi:23S rRNA (cytosine1962-C5)-methyltransferase
MFSSDQYELLDFGRGRKLERWGPFVLDRPAPAVAEVEVGDRRLWPQADACFTRRDAASGDWTTRAALSPTWSVQHAPITLALRRTRSGAVGVYPEQAGNWDWIERHVRRGRDALRVLNLFAYTGASSLVAAAAGAAVVHVDSARPVVQWARHNADLSQLARAPIRWIVDDARKFVQRELRRGHPYDAVILDPPTYGHGFHGEPWELARDLEALLVACARLTCERRAFMLLTCHTPTWGPAELAAMLADALHERGRSAVAAQPLSVRTADGRSLPSGVAARWPAD